MRQKNAHGLWRVLIPEGHTQNGRAKLRGCSISDENHNYLGYAALQDLPKDIRRELQRELEANWLPPTYDPEAL